MLMTHSYRPKLSVSGVVLAVGLAVAGWIATPAQSSEPPDKIDAGEAIVIGGAPAPAYMLVGGDDRDLEARMHRLERQMARLNELMERFDELLIVVEDEDEDEGFRRRGAAGRRARPPRPPRLPRIPSLPPLPTALPEEHVITIPAPAPMPSPLAETFITQSSGEVLVRSYELPKGKLEALTELMVRKDVPVLVGPQKNCIEVHGTEAQHAIFAAFVRLIHPPAKDAPGRSAQKQSQSHSCGHTVGAERLIKRCQKEGRKMLAKATREGERAKRKAGREAREAKRLAERLHKKAIAGAARARAGAEAQREALEEQAEALQKQLEALEKQLEEAEEQAEAEDDEDSY
jgi:hypothetical protein